MKVSETQEPGERCPAEAPAHGFSGETQAQQRQARKDVLASDQGPAPPGESSLVLSQVEDRAGERTPLSKSKTETNLANSLNRHHQFGHTNEVEARGFCKAKLTQVVSCCASENQNLFSKVDVKGPLANSIA